MSDLRLTCVVSGDMSKITGRARDRIASAATSAMRDAAGQLKAKGRAAIASGMKSVRFQNAFRTKTYPENGASLSPSVFAYHKIAYAGVFEDGAKIAGHPLLWLPLFTGGKRMGPRQFEQQVGPLSLIKRPGKPPLLGTIIRTTDKRLGSGLSLSALKRGFSSKTRGTAHIVPVFVGIPRITDPKKFDLNDVARDVAAGVGDAILKNLGRSDG